MNLSDTILVLLSVAVSMSLVLAGIRWSIDLEDRLRREFIVAALLGYLVMAFVGLPSLWLSNVVVILASVTGAQVIGSLNRSKGGLVSFLVSAAVVDYFSFSGGLTRWIIEGGGGSSLLQYLSVALPVGGRVRYLIGIGDLLIAGAAGFSLFRLGYPAWRTYLVVLFAVLIALSVALVIGGIPALPVIALVTGLYISIQPIE
jgi:hypothetical protein